MICRDPGCPCLAPIRCHGALLCPDVHGAGGARHGGIGRVRHGVATALLQRRPAGAPAPRRRARRPRRRALPRAAGARLCRPDLRPRARAPGPGGAPHLPRPSPGRVQARAAAGHASGRRPARRRLLPRLVRGPQRRQRNGPGLGVGGLGLLGGRGLGGGQHQRAHGHAVHAVAPGVPQQRKGRRRRTRQAQAQAAVASWAPDTGLPQQSTRVPSLRGCVSAASLRDRNPAITPINLMRHFQTTKPAGGVGYQAEGAPLVGTQG